MSTGPSCALTSRTSASIWPRSVTSSGTAMARPPLAVISAAAARQPSISRAAMTTCAPASASACARLRPMPVRPPVTTATLPVNLKLSKRAIVALVLLRVDDRFYGVGDTLADRERFGRLIERETVSDQRLHIDAAGRDEFNRDRPGVVVAIDGPQRQFVRVELRERKPDQILFRH